MILADSSDRSAADALGCMPRRRRLRKRLNLLLMRVRWPMSALAMLALALTVMSKWWFAACFVHMPVLDQEVGVQVGQGGIVLRSNDSDSIHNDAFQFRADDRGPWVWGISTSSQAQWGFHSIRFPLWAVALVPTALAVAGLWARRNIPVSGLCEGCRYPLRGAATCPECGRTASRPV